MVPIRQAFAGHEASTRLLEILPFLLLSTASLAFILCVVCLTTAKRTKTELENG